MGQPKYLNDRPEGRSNLRPGGLAEEEQRPLSDSGPPLRPERSLRSLARLRTTSATGRPGHSSASGSDPRLRPERSLQLQPPTDSLSDRKAQPKHYFRLRPHVSNQGTQNPCSLLFSDWRNQSRLGPTDRGRPPVKDQGTNGERQGKEHKSNHGTRDCTLYTCRNNTLQPP